MNFEKLQQKILNEKKEYFGDNIIVSPEEAVRFAGAGAKAVKLVSSDGDVFVRWDEIEAKANRYAKAIIKHFSEKQSSEATEDKELREMIIFVKEHEKRFKILEMLKKEGAMKIKKVGVELSKLIDKDLVKIENMIISLTNEGHEVYNKFNSFSEEATERDERTNKIYVGSAFSTRMLKEDCLIKYTKITEQEFNENRDNAYSIVGHEDTANILGVPFNRESIFLNSGDVLYLAELEGGRLPEGTKRLPEGFSFGYSKIEVHISEKDSRKNKE